MEVGFVGKLIFTFIVIIQVKNLAILLTLILLISPLVSYGLKCPTGTYYGRDDAGNTVCRDLNTNQIIDPNTRLPTGQFGPFAWVGIVAILILIIGIAVSRRKTKEPEYQDVERRDFSFATKEMVKEQQKGRCAKCDRIPTHWEFDHINGRGDNSIENCQGLCRDCHQDKTLNENR